MNPHYIHRCSSQVQLIWLYCDLWLLVESSMLSKWSRKQMELWEIAHSESMEITVPVVQRKLSGEHVREGICMLFGGRKSLGVLYIWKYKIYTLYVCVKYGEPGNWARESDVGYINFDFCYLCQCHISLLNLFMLTKVWPGNSEIVLEKIIPVWKHHSPIP